MAQNEKDHMAIEPVMDDEEPMKGEILINVSGHAQELDRRFGFWSVVTMGISVDNAWGAGAGALVTCLYNGGGPGVLYELIVATIFYIPIAAALAELSSAIPSSANVYHWASVTAGPRWGRLCSFYAGWWNYLAYLFGACSACLFVGNTLVAMYSLYHPEFSPQRWQIYIAYLGATWICSSMVLFGQRFLPYVTTFIGFFCLTAWLITTLVCAIMPSQTKGGYASNAFVWTEWQNQTGWSSNGFVFLAGMLNGAWTIGTPDAVCHLAEEVPDPKRNIPKGIAAQLSTGFVTSFLLYLSLMYAITDLDDVTNSAFPSLPVVAIFQQSTGSNAGTIGLLMIYFFNEILTTTILLLTLGRMLWTLGRDQATPFPDFIGKVNPTWKNPWNATFVTGVLVSLIGLIYIASVEAFNAMVGSFVIFTTMSYLAAILPHLLSGRKFVVPGPFWMKGWFGMVTIGIACVYIVVFNVIYTFPFALPVYAGNMNYSSLMTGGVTIFLTIGYLWLRTHGYTGPTVFQDAPDDLRTGHVLTGEELEKDRARKLVQGRTDGIS